MLIRRASLSTAKNAEQNATFYRAEKGGAGRVTKSRRFCGETGSGKMTCRGFVEPAWDWVENAEKVRGLLSAKGGLMMGTKKVGAFSSPRKKADSYYRLKN
jgi:hypothetical protein